MKIPLSWKKGNNIIGLWNINCIKGYVIGCSKDPSTHECNTLYQISWDKVKPVSLMTGLSGYEMLLQAFCLGREDKSLSRVHRKCWSWMYKWIHFNLKVINYYSWLIVIIILLLQTLGSNWTLKLFRNLLKNLMVWYVIIIVLDIGHYQLH